MQRYALLLAALAMSAGAAHAQKVKVDWDRTTDFAPFKTYKWSKIPTARTPTDEIEKLIKELTDVQLNAKGLKKIESGEPDLLVGYAISLGQPKANETAPSTPESSWQSGGSWSAKSSSKEVARQGTLNLDIADRRKNLLVWRGSILAEVGDSVNDARVKISKGLSKAFGSYPPPAK